MSSGIVSSRFLVALIATPIAFIHGQANTIVLGPDGRVLVPFHAGDSKTAQVIVHDVTEEFGKTLVLQYRFLPSFDNTSTPEPSDSTTNGVQRGPDLVFTIPLAHGHPPIIFTSLLELKNKPLSTVDYNAIIKRGEAMQSQLDSLDGRVVRLPEYQNLEQRKGEPGRIQARIVIRQKLLADSTAAVDELIKASQAEIAVFLAPQTEPAVAEIKRLQERIRLLRDTSAKLKATGAAADEAEKGELKRAQDAITKAQADLDATVDGKAKALLQAELDKSLSAATANGAPRYTIRTTAHLFLESTDAAVYYRMLAGANHVLALERAADFPVFTTKSHIFAVILNRRRTDFKEPFSLVVTTTQGTQPDITPVRPTTSITAQSAVAAKYEALDQAFTDFVLSFGPPFAANTVIKATISTMVEVTTVESESTVTLASTPAKAEDGQKVTKTLTNTWQSVELLKDSMYPQVRGLYNFNFASGVAVSWLRDHTFPRVKSHLDDPATKDVNETRYITSDVEGGQTVLPIWLVSVYFKQVDIQAPLTLLGRLTPALLLGFSITSPQDNLLVGFSNEVARNIQLSYGIHLGKITKRSATEAIDDPTSADLAATERRYAKSAFIALSFNISFIKTIFSGK